MKLIFVPMFLFTVVESFFFRDRMDFWCIKARGTLLALLLIPILFYTLNGAFGKTPDWINVTIFFMSAAIANLYELRQFDRAQNKCSIPAIGVAFFIIMAVLFVVFTFFPPHVGLFQDPTTGTFGI